MKAAKFVLGLALGAMLALAACEKEIPLPYNDGLVDQAQVIDADQDKQVGVPDRVGISEVWVKNFPMYNEKGEYWDNDKSFDFDRYPDLFVVIHDAQTKEPDILNTAGDCIENATPQGDNGWKFVRSVEIMNPTLIHRIALYDYDGLSKNSELMHEAYFKPFDGANGLPESIELNSRVASFVINLDYHWYRP